MKQVKVIEKSGNQDISDQIQFSLETNKNFK